MPLAVSFRWKTPAIQAAQPDSVKNGWDRSLTQAAQGIASAKERRFNREQAERRNRIEEEDRARRIEEEDRRRKVYGEAADIMRAKSSERAALVKEAEAIRAEIAQLKAQAGGR